MKFLLGSVSNDLPHQNPIERPLYNRHRRRSAFVGSGQIEEFANVHVKSNLLTFALSRGFSLRRDAPLPIKKSLRAQPSETSSRVWFA